MDNVIGFGGSIHDFATCLLTDDSRFIAVEDERLSRVRYAFGETEPCRKSLEYCLALEGLEVSDIGWFGANDMLHYELSIPEVRPEWINHHYSHAASVFFTSPYREAAILVADGAGSVVCGTAAGRADEHERETVTWAMGRDNDIVPLGRVTGTKRGGTTSNDVNALMSNSLGDLYRAFTEAIGFGFLQAGKTMGLAAYGDDRFVERLMTPVRLDAAGTFTVQVDGTGGLLDIISGIKRGPLPEDFHTNACIAAAGQEILETILVHVLNELWDRTRCPNLCVAGGVGLNCVFNGKITELTPFRDVFVGYAPGDSGTAIGAAIAGRLALGAAPAVPWRPVVPPYLGREYPGGALDGYGTVLPEGELVRAVARLLLAGKVVAWFRGGSEFGPRALGNRSLLASPGDPAMRGHLNTVKAREWFRPVAPVVLDEYRQDFFAAPAPSPYMQFSFPVREHARDLIPAASHVDGSARLQSVTDGENPSLAALLREFHRMGGPPVLVNTSLNLRGEPIAETPEQALRVLAEPGVDALVCDGRLIRK